MIQMDSVSFSYGDHRAVLEDFSLQINKGSFTAILGRNGSGKSTVARLMNGLLLPSEGRVLVDGMDTADEMLIYKIRSRAALVFQNPDDQIVSAVVEDETAFGAENLGIPSSEIRERVDSALRTVGLYEKRLCMTTQLSGGEKQRMAIASALVMQPKLLILDEPTAMLDPSGRREFLKTVQTLHAQGMTVVLITHAMEEAAMAERCVVMDSGKIILDGTPAEVFENTETMAELSLGVPDMRLLAEELGQYGIAVPKTILTVKEMADYLENLFKKESC